MDNFDHWMAFCLDGIRLMPDVVKKYSFFRKRVSHFKFDGDFERFSSIDFCFLEDREPIVPELVHEEKNQS